METIEACALAAFSSTQVSKDTLNSQYPNSITVHSETTSLGIIKFERQMV